jgi:hypothetical protein
MKSNHHHHRQHQINEFWTWFSANAEALAANPEDSILLEELDGRVHRLGAELSWEIGPGLSKPWQLVISPNLDRDLRELTRSIVAEAPSLNDWEFHPTRQRKEWDYKVELTGEDGGPAMVIDASNWTFVLLRYPDGIREILLKGAGLPVLEDDERWQAAAITLEGILGEDVLLETVDEFELVDNLEPRFAERERPIQGLRSAVMGN